MGSKQFKIIMIGARYSARLEEVPIFICGDQYKMDRRTIGASVDTFEYKIFLVNALSFSYDDDKARFKPDIGEYFENNNGIIYVVDSYTTDWSELQKDLLDKIIDDEE